MQGRFGGEREGGERVTDDKGMGARLKVEGTWMSVSDLVCQVMWSLLRLGCCHRHSSWIKATCLCVSGR
jgi:hypothetical protein